MRSLRGMSKLAMAEYAGVFGSTIGAGVATRAACLRSLRGQPVRSARTVAERTLVDQCHLAEVVAVSQLIEGRTSCTPERRVVRVFAGCQPSMGGDGGVFETS